MTSTQEIFSQNSLNFILSSYHEFLATSCEHVDAHSRFAALIRSFLDWMEASRLSLDRLDGLGYVSRESAVDTMDKIEMLQLDCRQGEALINNVRLELLNPYRKVKMCLLNLLSRANFGLEM